MCSITTLLNTEFPFPLRYFHPFPNTCWPCYIKHFRWPIEFSNYVWSILCWNLFSLKFGANHFIYSKHAFSVPFSPHPGYLVFYNHSLWPMPLQYTDCSGGWVYRRLLSRPWDELDKQCLLENSRLHSYPLARYNFSPHRCDSKFDELCV